MTIANRQLSSDVTLEDGPHERKGGITTSSTTGEFAVVLLHGMWRTRHSMEPLRKYIEHKLGLRAISIGYPTRPSLDELALSVARDVRNAVGENGKVFAVTHSLGGIVLRYIMGLPDQGGVRWTGCCMMAPPNSGSAVARTFNTVRLTSTVFRLATGKAGEALANGLDHRGNTWPAPPSPCGVIAGTRSLALMNPTSWLTTLLGLHGGNPNDGTVAVRETVVEGMTDFVTVHADHTLIMHYTTVMDAVLNFIQHHTFGEASQLHEAAKYRMELHREEQQEEQSQKTISGCLSRVFSQ